MESFSLDKWLQDKSRKVVTRSGVEAEIIHDKYPLVAIINGVAYNFDNDGKFQSNRAKHPYDLFFADKENELTEFEKTMIQFSHERNSLIQFEHTTDEINAHLNRYSKKLLDLARKELRKEEQEKLGTLEMPIDTTNPHYIKGKEDALKDLPKWRECEFKSIYPSIVDMLGNAKLCYKNHKIDIKELIEKLPKEE